MFKFNILYESLKHCIDNDMEVTDESQALEILGHSCRVHIGQPYNIILFDSKHLLLVFLESTERYSRGNFRDQLHQNGGRGSFHCGLRSR